jgi:mono/diheme cytochrome c family protein
VRRALSSGVIGAALAVFALPALAQDELPAGPDRELVAKTCAGCHDLKVLVDTHGLSREDWDGTLDDMAAFGLRMTAEQRAKILEYLVTYMPKR